MVVEVDGVTDGELSSEWRRRVKGVLRLRRLPRRIEGGDGFVGRGGVGW